MKRRELHQYHLPGSIDTITASNLRRADKDTQLEVMRHWFHANYANPVENTPYESDEGGYIYIWGGPFDPHEELQDEFNGIIQDETIEELAEELSAVALEWTGHPDSEDVDDFLFDSIASFTKHLETFQSSILNIKQLLKTPVEKSSEQCFRRVLYVNVITAIETYLSDFFISSISSDPLLLRRLVETSPDFKAEKISTSELFKALEQIEQRVRTYLMDVVWHHLTRIKPMFRDALGVEFPTDMSGLFKAVLVRHDIVHRNGRTKEGQEHVFGDKDVIDLIDIAESFVMEIENR
jgi:hypothetical protein